MRNIGQRHKVFRSDRLKVIENIIKSLDVKTILEIGAADYSFAYVKDNRGILWVKADVFSPCDILCNFNSPNFVLPFSERTFDLIICTEILEHLIWPQQLLKEVNRVLSIDGKVLLSVPNIASFSYRVAWLFGHIPSCAASGNMPLELGSTSYQKEDGELIGGHVVDFNLRRIISLLKYTGFEIISVKGSGVIWHRQILPHWVIPSSLSSNIICLAKK